MGMHRFQWGRRAAVAALGLVSMVGVLPATTAATSAGASPSPTGSIAGRLTEDRTGAPVGRACVTAQGADGSTAGITSSQVDGSYQLRGLAPGTYSVGFAVCPNADHRAEWYGDAATAASSTPVRVGAGQPTSGIDGRLTGRDGAIAPAAGDDTGPTLPPAGTGHITGKVTLNGPGTPLAGICVRAVVGDPAFETPAASATTAANGTYDLSGLATDNYDVYFTDCTFPKAHVSEYTYDALEFDTAIPIAVVNGSTSPNVDAALDPAGGVVVGPTGTITGTVTAHTGGAPLENVSVCASTGGCATTAANGTYSLTAKVGDARVQFSPPFNSGLLSEYWNDAATFSAATVVPVSVGSTTPNINAALDQASIISGKVTADPGTTAIESACVSASNASGGSGGFDTTDSAGTYLIGGLRAGDYKVSFSDCSGAGYLGEYYNNKPSFSTADPVHVTTAATTANINAGLATGGKISGKVTKDGAPATTLEDICVSASAIGTSSNFASASTAANGTYTLKGLAPGTYAVHFNDCSDDELYLQEYYNNKQSYDDATPVTVTGTQTTANINAALALASRITGTVTGQVSGAPLGDICIGAFDGGTLTFGFGSTLDDGTYVVGGLRAGSYQVSFDPCSTSTDYAPENYNDSLGASTPVAVTAGQTKTGISASLARAGHLGGRVEADGTHRPLESVCAEAENETHPNFGADTSFSDAHGRYAFRNMAAGSYTVSFSACGDDDVDQEWYDDQPDDTNAVRLSINPMTVIPFIDAGLSVPGEGGGGHVVADFTGDGITDIAVFRPSNGTWYVNGQPSVAFGTTGDIPVPGDYDGDGTTDLAVFRPSTGRWYIRGVAGSTAFGSNGDIPVPGDYDGDGSTDLAVFRPSTGKWYVQDEASVAFGTNGDIPVPGAWLTAGTTSMAVFRPSTSKWYVRGGATTAFGTTGDVPVPADYDGNGLTEVAVFRKSTGKWYVSGGATVAFGTNGDVPSPGQWDADAPADRAVFRRSSGRWYVEGGGGSTPLGSATDIPLVLPWAIYRTL